MPLLSRPRRFCLLIAVALLAAAPSLQAQDVSGSWLMDMNGNIPDEAEPCVYSGTCVMDQTGNDLTGTVALSLVSGPAECEPEMNATIAGVVDGDNVFGTLTGAANEGEATFEGSRSNSFVGSFATTDGPFVGSEGDWLAVRPASVLEIPTLSGVGLTLLVLALLAGGAWVLRGRRDESHPA